MQGRPVALVASAPGHAEVRQEWTPTPGAEVEFAIALKPDSPPLDLTALAGTWDADNFSLVIEPSGHVRTCAAALHATVLAMNETPAGSVFVTTTLFAVDGPLLVTFTL